jgi:hypothetical protein
MTNEVIKKGLITMLNFVPHGGNGVSFQRIVGWEVAIVNKA